MTALLIFNKNGSVRLVTTTSEALIQQILNVTTESMCKYILSTNDKSYIEYLWSQGYKNNMRAYRFWEVSGKELVEKIKNYNFKVLKGSLMNESYKLTMEDISLMVEMALNKLRKKEHIDNNIGEITPGMILSDDIVLP